MSTVIEDPGIPLVGRNGSVQSYTQDSKASTLSGNIRRATLSAGKAALAAGKFENVGYRLARRKELFQRRKVICDFALCFALIGILLMVVETECAIAHRDDMISWKERTPSLLIKSCVTISTVTLLGFVVWYHVLDVNLFMCDNWLDDWQLAISWRRLLAVTIELLVYAIHPPPGRYEFSKSAINALTDGRAVAASAASQNVPVDVLLTIPMFLRLYLFCRVKMLHSKLFTDASSQSLGALNRIRFNFKFIFKSMMTLHPAYVLTVLMVSSCIIASWLLRACEMYHDNVHANFLNSMWLISITFLSVGYGDIVPNSHCGRTVAVLTGIFGAGCTALVVAVLARKLELSRAEKYVHNFVIDVELSKRFKVAAANIVKAGWFVYTNKRLGRQAQARRYQRKLLQAVQSIREVKQEQKRLMDSGVSAVEMYKTQNVMCTVLSSLDTKQMDIDGRITAMETKLTTIDSKLDAMHSWMMAQSRQPTAQ